MVLVVMVVLLAAMVVLVVVALLELVLDPQLHLDKEILVELVDLEVLIWEVEAAAQVALVLVDLLVALVVLVLKCQQHLEILPLV